MDEASESLFRSALHDMANILAGLRGISGLEHPLTAQDRERLEAAFAEGNTTLSRCLGLALETLPDVALEPGTQWRGRLQEELAPLGALFRRTIHVAFEGGTEWDQWPGPRLRALAHALTRQVLPYAKTDPLTIRCVAAAGEWRLHWSPVTRLPEHLALPPGHPPSDICARWAAATADALGATLCAGDGTLQARIPR